MTVESPRQYLSKFRAWQNHYPNWAKRCGKINPSKNYYLGSNTNTLEKITKSKKLKIGYVPQKLKLNDSLPLNVERFLKLTGRFSKQEILEALKLVGAEHLMKSNMHQLSGGENQRVLVLVLS
ncbi:ATP-binding cassette domain-containing protein [Vibrio chagasii]|nr:ATP-binding cassette domain-containing protein [Vibrio chagasii]